MMPEQKLAGYAQMMEEYLPTLFPQAPEPESTVLDAMRYSLLGGGKRIRGALVLAFYELLQEDAANALPYAGALEMVHAYSLIHDDLPCMDNDDVRRGKPSCHIAFGESTALLAGDGLLNLAFETMTDSHFIGSFSPKQVVDAVRCLAHASGCQGMIGGQVVDLAMENQEISPEIHVRMISKKTGALMRCAGELGCILGDATPEITRAAVGYCDRIGLAFQIQDDILDVTSSAEVLGKPIGSDTAQGKRTWVGLHGLEASKTKVLELNLEAKECLAQIPGELSFLSWLADSLGARKH